MIFSVKLDDGLCCLHNSDDELCYLRNPTRVSPRAYVINQLPEDVFSQILVRLPPHPTSLLQASVAQKSWMHLMESDHFRKLTLSHNGGTPVLGFFTNSSEDNRFITEHDLDQAILQKLNIPVSSRTNCKLYVLACRHGRVLLHSPQGSGIILAWDPINAIDTEIPRPSIWRNGEFDSGAILCSGNHGGPCSHSCQSSNFWVVWIVTGHSQALVQRYSSELGVWEKWTAPAEMLAEIDNRSATLISGILYWPMKSRYIIAFDNVTRDLYYIECPHETHDIFRRNLHIFKGHNGDVALAVIRDFTLQTWSSERLSTGKWKAWVPDRKLELDTLLGLDKSWPYHGKYAVRLLCAFEDRDIMIVRAKEGVFQLDIRSLEWKKFKSRKLWSTMHPYSMTPG